LLEAYQDGARGLRLMAPSGWNKFEGEVGAYDIKWQDLVDPTENIKISSSPVKSTTESIDALGDVKELGPKLAAKRNAKLISATDRTTEGILFYTFDFALPDKTHQLLLLCVAKGKLWSVDASAKEKRWGKREELYKNVLGSFVPRLNAYVPSSE
jgi:photosystem II oxygen-evolving enhancer protein 2